MVDRIVIVDDSDFFFNNNIYDVRIEDVQLPILIGLEAGISPRFVEFIGLDEFGGHER